MANEWCDEGGGGDGSLGARGYLVTEYKEGNVSLSLRENTQFTGE